MPDGKTFPALSLRQPWADWVVDGVKDIENRNWSTRFRGTILIHAARRLDDDVPPRYRALAAARGAADEEPVTGAVIGMVDIVDCVRWHRSRWFMGRYGFVLERPRRFRTPVPFRGSLGIFRVPVRLLRGTGAARARPGSLAG